MARQMKFHKKPIMIEAFQMTEERRWDNREWPDWLNRAWNMEPRAYGEGGLFIDADDPGRAHLLIGTLEGVHRVQWNDWIIRGVKGELYACKPDIFQATYEPVDEDDGAPWCHQCGAQIQEACKWGPIAENN